LTDRTAATHANKIFYQTYVLLLDVKTSTPNPTLPSPSLPTAGHVTHAYQMTALECWKLWRV